MLGLEAEIQSYSEPWLIRTRQMSGKVDLAEPAFTRTKQLQIKAIF